MIGYDADMSADTTAAPHTGAKLSAPADREQRGIMPAPGLDPAPRSYSPGVTLLRRSDRGAAAAPEAMIVEEIEAWLLSDAIAEDDLLALFEALVWRLARAGLALDRASLHIGTLHPQLYGFAWNWSRMDGLCDELKVPEAALGSDSYRRTPLFRAIEHGEAFRGNLEDRAILERFPFMAELAAQGFSDYVLMPLRAGSAYHNVATVATQRPGGFPPDGLADLERIFALFALHVERHIVLRLAGNVLDTYLGAAAGGQVLRGSIKRGAGEPIRAIIWASDLRGFTALADRLDGPDMIALLNAYFERMAEAVMNHGGEVLKFIGDGLLAVFPFSAFAGEKAAAEASLAAAGEALAAIDQLNAEPPDDLAGIDGWRPLRTSVALHEGKVFFGNVGAPERLDFTVIGPAVNAANRVEALSKSLGRSLLLTEPVARLLDRPLDHLGEHALRGVGQAVSLYAPQSRQTPVPRRRR